MNHHHQNRNTACEVSPDFMCLLWSWLQGRCDDGARQLVDVYQIHGNSIFTAHNDGSGDFNEPSKIIYPTYEQSFKYDSRNRLVSETRINGTETLISTFAYDGRSKLISATDAKGNVRSYGYDALGRQITETDPLGQIVEFGYDNRDNIISVKDGNGNITLTEYDRNNRIVKETKPLGQITSYAYDANGNLTDTIQPSGRRSHIIYDDAGRYTSAEEYSSATATTADKTVSYTYNLWGQLETWNDGTQSGTFSYDTLGRKTGETVNYGPFALSYVYGYNANGSKSSFIGPDGVTATYLYDDNNQLSTVQLPGGGITINEYNWTAPKQITLPGGTVQSFSYNDLLSLESLEVKSSTQNIIAQLSYSHDALQNVTAKSIDTSTNSYSYDNNQSLVQALQAPLGDRTYTLDAVGNRTAAGNGEIWSYDANNQLLNRPSVSYSYDSNGNLTQKTEGSVVTNYSYDHNNRLVHVEDGNANTLANYGYDPFGRRLWKEISGIKTYYFYSDEGLIAEYGQTGTQLVSYGYRPDSTWGVNPLYLRNDSGFYFYHNDNLGTPFKLTAVDGSVVWSAIYDAYGQAQVDAASTVTNNLRFPGQYFDAETNLHYNYFRYYDPAIGRYISSDPIGLAGGINTYAYVNGNPLNWSDPYGLQTCAGGDDSMDWFYDYVMPGTGFIDGYNAFGNGQYVYGVAMVGSEFLKPLKILKIFKKVDNAVPTPSPSMVPNSADKWSRAPKSIQDQMTLKAAQEGQGNVLIKNLNDPKFKGMEKMELKVKSNNGNDSVVHYVRDPKTGNLMDFKFKKHSTDQIKPWGNDPAVPPGG